MKATGHQAKSRGGAEVYGDGSDLQDDAGGMKSPSLLDPTPAKRSPFLDNLENDGLSFSNSSRVH